MEIQECWHCHNPITEEDPQTELPCHHRLHTTCFTYVVFDGDVTSCPLCNVLFNYPAEAEQQEADLTPQEAENIRIQNLYDTNARFKTMAKKLVQKKLQINKTRVAAIKLVKQKKQEIRDQLLLLKAQLEGLTSLKKNEIQESQQYKEYLKAKRSYTVLENTLQRDHNCSSRAIARALSQKPGFRRFNPRERWRHNSYYLFQRPWNFHIPI